MSLRSNVKAFLPDRLVGWLTVAYHWAPVQKALNRWEFRRDERRYIAHASLTESSSSRLSGVGLESQLTRDYHRVEKALALPAPKRPFGESLVLSRLNKLIPLAEGNADGTACLRAAVAARDALLEWNSTGVIADEVAPAAPSWEPIDCEGMFASRRSVRHYSPKPVDLELVRQAIEMAAYSPSVCNRQPWKVRLFSGKEIVRMLRYQNGNSGFTENIPLLALVSVEIGHFFGAGERNQAWIEGGIFSSTLVWALHANGLNSCMLNLSITNSQADLLRAEAKMPASELPIMMVAIGHGAEGHRAARSVRRRLGEIIVQNLAVHQMA